MSVNISDLSQLQLFKLFDSLSQENIQINPVYIALTGSLAGGYFLTQLIYLSRYNKYEEFSAKDKYFMEKLLLSEWELRTQKKNLSNLGLVSIRHGKGNITYYSVNIPTIIQLAVDKSLFRSEDSSAQKRGFLGTRNEDSSSSYKGNKTHYKHSFKNTEKPHVDKMRSHDKPHPQSVFKKINSEDGNVNHLVIRLQEIEGITEANIKWIFKNFEQFEIVNVLESFKNVRSFKKGKSAYVMGGFQKIISAKGENK
jgi:hypothetical protein